MNAITPDDVLRVIREHPHIPTVAEIAVTLQTDILTVRACLTALRAAGRVQPLPAAESAA